MDSIVLQDDEKIYMDTENLTREELDELAWLVVRKLRKSMREESERSGRCF